MKKILLILFLAIIFVGNFFKIAQAKIETFEGTGSYPITDEKTHGEVKELAKREAVRDALEKAGVAVFSQVEVKNNMITKDIIKITAGSILKILSDKYNFIQLDENDGIGMYKATVVISIDSDELNLKLQDFLKREIEEQLKITKQYEDLQKFNDANTKRIAELEKQLAEKNAELDKQKILNEIAEIDKDTLYAQKIDEGWKDWENKNFEQALQLFEEAVKLNPNDYQGYLGLGTTNVDLKNYEQALDNLNKGIKLNSNYDYAYNNRGWTYYNLKNYSQAIEDYNQAIKINPNYALAYNNRGVVYLYLKNYQQAMSDFNQAIKLNPNFDWAYNNRGSAYFDLKNYSQAISDYTQAIKINPNYSMAYNNRGWVYFKLKNYTQALKDSNKAIELDKNNAYAYDTRGNVYKSLGNNSQAEKDFAKVRELANK